MNFRDLPFVRSKTLAIFLSNPIDNRARCSVANPIFFTFNPMPNFPIRHSLKAKRRQGDKGEANNL